MTRILTGALLGGLIAAAILWAPSWVVLGLALAFVVLATGEYVALTETASIPAPRGATLVAAVALCAAVPWAGGIVAPVVMAVVLAQSALAVGWLPPDARTIARVSAAVFGPLYIGLPLGSLVAVHWTEGPLAALLLIATIVISDTAQYYGGRLLGRRPLAPVLSPGKTVEGAVSGMIVGTVAFAVLGARVWPSVAWPVVALVGFALVVLGIVGDLFESMLKRGVGAKDSSALIPGHGGVLDRIDALLFAAPVYYVVLQFAVGA